MSRARWYIVMICLLLAGMSAAAPRKTKFKTAGLTHWVGLSLTGVEANALPGGEHIHVNAGAGAGGHLLYELRAGGFFFNAGVGADYMVTNTTLDIYTDAFGRVDHTGDALLYRYNYRDITEQQRQVRIMIPLQVGYQFGDYVYIGAGAAFRTAPLLNTIGTRTYMYTQGEYERFIEPFRNAPLYGFWPEDEYEGTGTVQTAPSEIAAELEIGVNIPLKYEKMRLRAGVFAGYDFPLSSLPEADERIRLTDYSAVNTSPYTQSMEDLKENIRFNSMLDTSLAGDKVNRLRIGLRLTVLFDVTPKPKHCMCWK